MFIKVLKDIGLITVVVGLAVLLGYSVNAIVPWTRLTELFAAGRYLVSAMDWLVDTSTLFICVGLSIGLDVAEWALVAGMVPVHYLHDKK